MLIAVVLVAMVVACLSYIGTGAIYKGLGRTGLSLDEPDLRPEPVAGSPAAMAEAQEEIRQMLEAKSARSEARGDGPIDIDAEMAALTAARHAAPTPPCARRSASWWWPATSAALRRGEEPAGRGGRGRARAAAAGS